MTEDPKMTSPDLLKLRMIQTLLETIDIDDEDDQKAAVKQIKALFFGADKEAK